MLPDKTGAENSDSVHSSLVPMLVSTGYHVAIANSILVNDQTVCT